MNILITNLSVSGISGTELYVKELAFKLADNGHHIEVFTIYVGELSKEFSKRNILVSSKLKDFSRPDIIHGNHNIPVIMASGFFENVPIVFFIHDRLSPFDHPYFNKNILRYCAVDDNCKERYLDNHLTEDQVEVIYNWVNPERFIRRSQISPTARKAIVFSNYISKTHIFPEIQKACKSEGIELDLVGSRNGNSVNAPEDILLKYDLVFGKAKAGIEAMATGAAFIICDYTGLGEMVTLDNVELFRRFNFGMKLMTKRVTVSSLITEIKKYDAVQIKGVSEYIILNSNLDSVVSQLENLYKQVITDYKNEARGPRVSSYNFLEIYFSNFKTVLYIQLRKYNFIFKIARTIYKNLIRT